MTQLEPKYVALNRKTLNEICCVWLLHYTCIPQIFYWNCFIVLLPLKQINSC